MDGVGDLLRIGSWIIIGFFAGFVASLLLGEPQGCVKNIVVGCLGAVLGGWIFELYWHAPRAGLNLESFLVALVGSVLLLIFFQAIRSPRKE